MHFNAVKTHCCEQSLSADGSSLVELIRVPGGGCSVGAIAGAKGQRHRRQRCRSGAQQVTAGH